MLVHPTGFGPAVRAWSRRCIGTRCGRSGYIHRPGTDAEEDANQQMRTVTGAARESMPPAEAVSTGPDSDDELKLVIATLEDAKAEKIVTIDLKGKSSIGDYMVIASGRTDRHVGAIAEQVQRKLKEEGHGAARIEGEQQCDWVVIDTGSIIVHVFRPEVREFYNLEKMWQAERPAETTQH